MRRQPPGDGDRTMPSWRHAIGRANLRRRRRRRWLYDPKAHRLTQVLADKSAPRPACRISSPAAPLDLVYVSDGARLQGAAGDEKRLWAFTDVGFIGQNVYLFCASEGLATVFRASLEPRPARQNAATAAEKFITCAQTVGYPKS